MNRNVIIEIIVVVLMLSLLILLVIHKKKSVFDYKTYNYKKYDLILGKDACQVFYAYRVSEMHGLSIEGAKKRISQGGSYIDGLSNYHPKDKKLDMKLKPFIFLNLGSLNKNYSLDEIHTAVMHETMHMAIKCFNYDLENHEEDMITWAESEANKIIKLLNKEKYI